MRLHHSRDSIGADSLAVSREVGCTLEPDVNFRCSPESEWTLVETVSRYPQDPHESHVPCHDSRQSWISFGLEV